jgi:hypothetical protein
MKTCKQLGKEEIQTICLHRKKVGIYVISNNIFVLKSLLSSMSEDMNFCRGGKAVSPK